jgi:hypothetical protein
MDFFSFLEAPEKNQIAELLKKHNTKIVIGHPTYKNAENIGSLIQKDVEGLQRAFPDEHAAIVISDGTKNTGSDDVSVFNAARSTIEHLKDDAWAKTHLLYVFSVYDGYEENRLPGKGSALKLVFNEFYQAETPEYLYLFDGDIKNDIGTWLQAYKKILADFEKNFGQEKPCFVTAKYARHFVDASLTRFVVSPLTTLVGMFVPGGISGDILLNREAVHHEVTANWSESRYKYGTDIATTFDNIYHKTVIYEAYLGAKLHDITDEAKLSVMPGEVIGSALERLLNYEEQDHFITNSLQSDRELTFPIIFDSQKTGIDFIDPGFTDVFDIKKKMESLIIRFPDFQGSLQQMITEEDFYRLKNHVEELQTAYQNDSAPLTFINMSTEWYTDLVYQILARLLKTKDINRAKKAYQYLYTGAFLEFCKKKLQFLGCQTIRDVLRIQKKLGVPAEKAKEFYKQEVDQKIQEFSINFYHQKGKILEFMRK